MAEYAAQQQQERDKAKREVDELRAKLASSRHKREKLVETNTFLNSTIHRLHGPTSRDDNTQQATAATTSTTTRDQSSDVITPDATTSTAATTSPATAPLPVTPEAAGTSQPAAPPAISPTETISSASSLFEAARQLITSEVTKPLTQPLSQRLGTSDDQLDLIMSVLSDPSSNSATSCSMQPRTHDRRRHQQVSSR